MATIWMRSAYIAVLLAAFPRAQPGGAPVSDDARRASMLAVLKMPDPKPEEPIRDMYVFELANMYQGKPDRDLIRFFLRLIARDPAPSVRLEAAADIYSFRIPDDLWPQVHGALDRCRKDSLADFQVLASQSLLALAAQRGTTIRLPSRPWPG